MGDVVFELLTEEMPARALKGAQKQLQDLLHKKLTQAGLGYQDLTTFATPRRLGAHIHTLDAVVKPETLTLKGPRIDAPDVALQGFLTKAGTTKAQLTQETSPKGTFWTATITTPAQNTPDMLPGLLLAIIQEFSWPARMFWGQGIMSWVRPVRRILLLWDQRPLAMEVNFDGTPLISSHLTEGHRFLGRGPFEVDSFATYQRTLREHYVMVCTQERRASILSQVQPLLAAKRLELAPHDLGEGGLLDEVQNLVEWPHVLLGRIHDDVMCLPDSVLATTMRVHQRCFPTYTSDGVIQPFFVAVANTHTPDDGQTITQGFERVIQARLKDALFLYEQDTQTPLKAQRDKLKQRLFFKGLGTLYQKTERLDTLAGTVLPTSTHLKQAATLSKADLATLMVEEFSELQGSMGGHYASREGLSPAVCKAIEGQYQNPAQQENMSQEARYLGLIDRLDSLYGFFALGHKPTGSKDPLALKRMGNTILDILASLPFVDIDTLLTSVAALWKDHGVSCDHPQVREDLALFFKERLSFFFKHHGYPSPLITFIEGATLYAPLDLQGRCAYGAWLWRLWQRPAFQGIIHAMSRATKILDKSAPPLSKPPSSTPEALQNNHELPDTSLFTAPEEHALWDQIEALHNQLTKPAMPVAPATFEEPLFSLSASIDKFFEAVMVNADDPCLRDNRIKLLARLHHLTRQFGPWDVL
ncbi:glycine--tRNA ligase subunit beta [bacterium NHP-B]|nr:glycine--tRNA ligase subunit beta [bacterium NHP-B]